MPGENSQSIFRNQDIILISNQMLEDRYWTSKQYITQELKKRNRVLYVEANYSFGKLLMGILGKGWPIRPFGKLYQQDENLWVLTPLPRLPLRNHLYFIGRLNQSLLKWKIRSALKRIEMEKTILWTFLHQTADLIGAFDEKVAIYHCVDDWPERLAMEKMGSYALVERDENALLKKVDVTFRVSEILLQGREGVGSPVHLAPNGVDIDLFHLNREGGFKKPQDMADLNGPVLGFAGSLGEWVDVDLIIQVAQEFPTASIVLIGQVDRQEMLSRLLANKNIHYLGMKPRTQVPDYLNNFDLCLMPFAKNRIGQGLMPLKMFQYLAMGKPIVATASPPLQPFRDVIELAEEPEDFILKTRDLLEERPGQNIIEARISRAESFSWSERINHYSEIVSNILSNKN